MAAVPLARRWRRGLGCSAGSRNYGMLSRRDGRRHVRTERHRRHRTAEIRQGLQLGENFRREFVRACDERADVPHLIFAECGAEARHSSEANSVFHFPVGLADGIVRDGAILREQLRR